MVEIKDNIIKFIFGGNSLFTITNDNGQFSYKVYKKKGCQDCSIYYCYLKYGNKNIYLGYFKVKDKVLTYKHKTNDVPYVSPYTQSILNAIHKRNDLGNVHIYHHGRCACCGRALVDVASIERGFGPKCWVKVREHVQK